MSDSGFPRSARLSASAEFQRVFSKPQRIANHFFTVLFISNGGEQARLGMAISKRRIKRAVDRSRLKRLARESFRVRRDALAGFDLVIMAKTAASSTDKASLKASLVQLMDRLHRAEGGARSGRPPERNAPVSDPG